MNLPNETQEVHFRSPELISRSESALLVIDVQEKVLAQIKAGQQIVWNIDRLLRAAKILNVSCSNCEQYPERLGTTVSPLQEKLATPFPKRMFSCRECSELVKTWTSNGNRQIVIAGIETHVCMLQSALDLLAEGFSVFVVVDAVGSRGNLDHEVALRRMETCGAVLTSTESVLFEWCETSKAPEFKQISQLVLEQPPAS